MCMHLGESGQQVAPGAVDFQGVGRDFGTFLRADSDNPAVIDQDRLIDEEAFSVHGNHVDADEGDGLAFWPPSTTYIAKRSPLQHRFS